MGAGLSGHQQSLGDPSTDHQVHPGLGDLPESCLALALTGLDPEEICRLARVNWAFRQASSADFIWESKLPENYQILVKKLFDESPENLSKKDIYARLCHPNRFDDGATKEVWMDKKSGKMCVSVSWKGMKITGIDDRRYWSHLPTDESRFHAIAYLQQIWWLEVDGSLEFEFPQGTYSLFFRLRLGRPTAGKRSGRRPGEVDRVHGWNIKPVRFQFSTSDGQQVMSQCYLIDEPVGRWVSHHVGDFVVENSNSPTGIRFSLTQIDCTHTKGGLCLDSVLILPKVLGR